MVNQDSRLQLLSNYQRRALRNYERILEATALNSDRILEFAEDDTAAVIPILRSMTDQAVRSQVIYDYTMIDMDLDYAIFRHFYGTGKKLKATRSTRRYKTLRLILQNLYILQKLSIVRGFKHVPKKIFGNITAINNLRNGMAHSFFLDELSPSKRRYKGHNVFTYKGLSIFKEDVWEIQLFFNPYLNEYFPKTE